MLWIFLLASISGFAQVVDLSAIQELDEELPNYRDYKNTEEEIKFQRIQRKFRPPYRKVALDEIMRSPLETGALKKGSVIREIESNKNYRTHKVMYVKYFKLEDEQGFKYLVNKDENVVWKVPSRFVEPLKEELTLYEPPHKYTPAPTNIVRAEYDKKLNIRPELSFYAGAVVGDYMRDLFDDKKARSGTSTQYGLHFFTQWKLPVIVGGVLHYERSTYQLTSGNKVIYSSPSIGPQIKTQDFQLFDTQVRFQTQLRVSPLARAQIENVNQTVKFNSTDLLLSLETPFKNQFGEFVLGAFFQNQWLNLKDQENLVNVRATNQTNKSFGISLSQVIE